MLRLCGCLCLLLLLLIAASVSGTTYATTPTPVTSPSPAAGPIIILSQTTQGKFRQNLDFHLRVKTSMGKITSAKLVWPYGISRAESFQAASEVDVVYRWVPVLADTPPFQLLTYHWEITDDAGNLLVGASAQAEITDETHSWQMLTDTKLNIY